MPRKYEDIAIKTRPIETGSRAGTEGASKVLVAYVSHFGTTGEIAAVIAETLRENGHHAEAKSINNIKNINGYDAVIVGSAIQYDRWMPEATEFVLSHQHELASLPVAFFFSCLTLSRKTKKSEKEATAYSDALYALSAQVKPLDVGRFAGVLDYSKMPFFARLVARSIMTLLRVQEGDHRDWAAIRIWARNTGSKLKGAQLCLPSPE